MKQLIYILSACLCALWICGCSSEQPNDTMTLTDIVTFGKNTRTGMTFTLQKDGDSPVIELTVAGKNIDSEQIKPGHRLLMAYIPESGKPYTSGPVTLKRLSIINYDTVKIASPERWDASPVYMYSMWRTGTYLNMTGRIDYATGKRRFLLVADQATLSDAVPQLYVVHDMGDLPENFTRRIYASWNIADVWNRPGCRGIDVHVHDSNRNIDLISFQK